MGNEDTPTGRRLKQAADEVARESVVSWPQALREARALTDDQLHAAAQGCTEISCTRHGAFNQVRRDRGIRP